MTVSILDSFLFSVCIDWTDIYPLMLLI
jgi:hypothetical protein